MFTKITLPAEKATAGAVYETPRGLKITVLGPVEGSTDVRVRNEHGREFTVPAAYPLHPTAQPAAAGVAALVGASPAALAAGVANLGADDLDVLEDMDPRYEVLAACAARRAALAKPTPAPAPAPAAAPAAEPDPSDTGRTVLCLECEQWVSVMEARDGFVRAVHSATGGAYCPGSGAKVGAPLRPALAPVAEPPAPAAQTLEREPEPAPEVPDPLRHFGGADDVDGRIDAVRRVHSLDALAELEAVDALQAKVSRELERQRKALEAVEAAGALALDKGDQRDLKRLAARQDYQNRPGVMARARSLFAQLHGRGDHVDHELKPAEPTPADLEIPAELTAETAPAELFELAGWICRHTFRDTVATALVDQVRDLSGTVRGSRAAIPACDDSATVSLAYSWEASRPEPRETILEQLAARITALGGTVPPRPEPGQVPLLDRARGAEPEPAADVRAPRVPEWAGMDDFGGEDGYASPAAATLRAELGLPAAARPALDVSALAHAGVPALPAAEALDDLARREAAASVPPWDLSALPVPDQIARAMRARALELVAELRDRSEVQAAIWAEGHREEGARPEVRAALEARYAELGPAAPPVEPGPVQPAPEAALAPEPEPTPAPTAATAPGLEAAGPARRGPRAAPPAGAALQAVQVRDLRRVDLPDGRAELWACPAGHRPIRVGDLDDPRLEPHRKALEAFQRDQAAHAPAAPADHVATAQAGLSALAAALPALQALGLDVTVTISTRRPA